MTIEWLSKMTPPELKAELSMKEGETPETYAKRMGGLIRKVKLEQEDLTRRRMIGTLYQTNTHHH